MPALHQDWVAPYWAIPTTPELDKVTFKEEHFNVPVMSCVDYVGQTPLAWTKAPKRARSKATQDTLEDTLGKHSANTCVQIPVLVNESEITAQTLLFRWAPEATKKAVKKAITVTTLVQKQALSA